MKQSQKQKIVNQIRITLANKKKNRRGGRKPQSKREALRVQTNLPIRPLPNKSLLDVQLEAERNKNRNDILGNQLSNINRSIINIRDQQLGQSMRLDDAIKQIKAQNNIQPIKVEVPTVDVLRPPLGVVSPGTQGVQAREAILEYLKAYKEYIPGSRPYDDERLDGLQMNQLQNLYQKTKQVIELAQTPTKLRTSQLEPTDPDFEARMRSAQKFLADRMAEVEQQFGMFPPSGGSGPPPLSFGARRVTVTTSDEGPGAGAGAGGFDADRGGDGY